MGIQQQQKLRKTDEANRKKLADAARHRLSYSKSDSKLNAVQKARLQKSNTEKSSVRDQNTIARSQTRAQMTDDVKAVVRDQDTIARNQARAQMTDDVKAVIRDQNTRGRKILRKKNSVVMRDRARDAVHAACKAGILPEPEDIDESDPGNDVRTSLCAMYSMCGLGKTPDERASLPDPVTLADINKCLNAYNDMLYPEDQKPDGCAACGITVLPNLAQNMAIHRVFLKEVHDVLVFTKEEEALFDDSHELIKLVRHTFFCNGFRYHLVPRFVSNHSPTQTCNVNLCTVCHGFIVAAKHRPTISISNGCDFGNLTALYAAAERYLCFVLMIQLDLNA